jgi:UDP-N-acetylglucosamine acyltransferase
MSGGPRIHPTAIVDAGAEIAAGVEIGPYCIVGGEVSLATGVRLEAHVVVVGRTSIGADTSVYPFASLGTPPQDLKYRGEPSRLTIGRGNTIREHVSMNVGTEGGGMETRVGDGCLFMVGSHVAHDCRIGDGVIIANNVALAGHVTIDDHARLSGLVAIHQHARIGRLGMVGGVCGVEGDVIPYGMALGNRARLAGLNVVGLRRSGASRAEIETLRRVYQLLFEGDGTFADRLEEAAETFAAEPRAMEIVRFIREGGSRPLCHPERRHQRDGGAG